MLTSETKRKIDNCRDSLVGKIPVPSAQIEQITLALIYKFMSDIDHQNQELGGTSFFEGDFAKYKWSNLMDKRLGAQERMNLYTEGLESMGKNKYLPELFRNIFRNAYLPFKDPQTLDRFLKHIDEFTYGHSEELGNAFEYLLSTAGSQGDAGQFRTPRHIIDFIVSVVEPSKDDTILDPACGTAGFLISAYKYILQTNRKDKPGDLLSLQDKKNLTKNIVGYDISHEMVRLSLVNLYLHNFGDPKIHEYDTLSQEDRRQEDYDCILANPPFMTPKGGIQPHKRFSIQANKSEVLFVDYIMEHLKINGKAGVIVPEGIIFQSATAYKALRKKMIEEKYLRAVVSLPSGVFQPYSGVKTSILLFDKQIAKKTDKILFIKANHDGFDLGAQRRVAGYEYNTEDVKIKLDPFLQELAHADHVIGQKFHDKIVYEIAGKKQEVPLFVKNDLPMAYYALVSWKQMLMADNPKAEEHVLLNNIASENLVTLLDKAQIVESGDYNLSVERYREAIATHSDWPMVELGEVCNFRNGFAFESSKYTDGGYQVMRITNVQKGFIDGKGPKYYPKEEVEKNLQDFILKENDLLMSLTGNVGRVGFLKQEHLPAVLNQRVAKIEAKEQLVSAKYLYHLMNTDKFEQDCIGMSGGVAQKNLGTTSLKTYTIPLPPLEVQQQIVAELDGYQKIIDGAKQVVENYKPTINIDPEWEMVKVSEICDLVRGSSPRPQGDHKYYGGPIPRLMVADLTRDGMYVIPQIDTLTEEGAKLSRPMKKGEVVMAVSGNPGVPAILGVDACIHDGFVGYRNLSTKILPVFLYYMLLYKKANNHIAADGAVFLNFTTDQIKQSIIPLPPLEVQQQIVAEIEKEQAMIESTKGLIEVFEEKIKERIGEVWGE